MSVKLLKNHQKSFPFKFMKPKIAGQEKNLWNYLVSHKEYFVLKLYKYKNNKSQHAFYRTLYFFYGIRHDILESHIFFWTHKKSFIRVKKIFRIQKFSEHWASQPESCSKPFDLFLANSALAALLCELSVSFLFLWNLKCKG